MELVFHIGSKEIEINAQVLLVGTWHSNHSCSIARYGIVQISAFDVDESSIIFVPNDVEETSQQLIGISTTLVDVIARMTTSKLIDTHTDRYISCRQCLTRIVKGGCGVSTSSTSHEYLSFVFTVEIDEILAFHESRLQSKSSRKTCFLVASEQGLNRAMFQCIICQNSHGECIANTTVGTECRTLCTYPLTVNVGFNWLLFKVEIQSRHLLANHIHVPLQNQAWHVLTPRSSRL